MQICALLSPLGCYTTGNIYLFCGVLTLQLVLVVQHLVKWKTTTHFIWNGLTMHLHCLL